MHRFRDSSYSVTSMCYDDEHELLWVGNSYGYVSSYLVREGMQKYSSFIPSGTSISEIFPIHKSVLSVSQSALRIHSQGGLPFSSFSNPPDFDGNSNAHFYTCGVVFRPPGPLLNSSDIYPTHLLAGTSSDNVHVYDISALGPPIATFNTGVASICCRTTTSGLYVAIGGGDGKLRLLDGRLRMKKIAHTLDGHSGLVSDFSIEPDGVSLVSCGLSKRSVNQYDPNSFPVRNFVKLINYLLIIVFTRAYSLQYVPDPLIRQYDLRMLRQLSPLPMPGLVACRLRFLPRSDDSAARSILLASEDGLLQSYELTAAGGVPCTNMFYSHIASETDENTGYDVVPKLTAIATSSSGQLVAVGSSHGIVVQLGSTVPEPTVNLVLQTLNSITAADHLTILFSVRSYRTTSPSPPSLLR